MKTENSQNTIFDEAAPVSEEYEEKINNLNLARIAAGSPAAIENTSQSVYSKTHTVARDYKKTYRNDPCPCGSGKKYKKCCLDSGRYETTHYVY